jgi:hypothetical protein
MMYILTYPGGDAAWFPDLAAVLEYIEYDAFGLMDANDCGAYFINPNGTWLDASRDIEAALIEHDEAMAWEAEHQAFISSPEKTGRV